MAELTLATLAAQVFTGLVLGMILVLLAIGLSLIFGLMTVVNFAHGSLYMLGAYLGFFLIGYTKSFWLALVVAPLLVGAFGFGIERFLVRRLYGRSIDDPLLLTFGLLLVMIEAARLIWGKIGLTLDPPRELAGAVDLGFTYFPLPPLRHRRHRRRPLRALPVPRENERRAHHPRGLTRSAHGARARLRPRARVASRLRHRRRARRPRGHPRGPHARRLRRDGRDDRHRVVRGRGGRRNGEPRGRHRRRHRDG